MGSRSTVSHTDVLPSPTVGWKLVVDTNLESGAPNSCPDSGAASPQPTGRGEAEFNAICRPAREFKLVALPSTIPVARSDNTPVQEGGHGLVDSIRSSKANRKGRREIL